MQERRLIHRISPHNSRGMRGRSLGLETIEETEYLEGDAPVRLQSSLSVDEQDRIERLLRGQIEAPEYTDEMPVQVFKWLSDPTKCHTLKSCAAMLGADEEKFTKWLQGSERLQYAVFAGNAIQEANFGTMLLQGFKYSSGVAYILGNLHSWTQKQRTEHALDLNAAIAAQEGGAKRVQWIDAEIVSKDNNSKRLSN